MLRTSASTKRQARRRVVDNGGCEERNDGHDVKPAVTGSARRGSGRVKPLFLGAGG